MNYSINEIASICQGTHLAGKGELFLKSVSFDSRKIWNSNGMCFFAIKGVNFDGHNFLSDAYEKGVRLFVISDKTIDYSCYTNADFIQVDNSIYALQKLAVHYRSQFKFPIIGITGSNGKTTVKEWLAEALIDHFSVVKTPKSYNSQIGVPISIFGITKVHDLGVFEAGISCENEMDKLEKIIQPDIGIFTNIGNAHDEFFESKDLKAREKSILFKSCNALIYNADDDFVHEAIKPLACEKISWSIKGKGTFNFSITKNGLESIALFRNQSIVLPFTDDASIENSLHVISTLIYLNIDFEDIQKKAAKLKNIAMRLERVQGMRNTLFINDVYNSDLSSFEAAIELLKSDETRKRKSLILSEMHNTGYSSAEITKRISEFVEDISFESVHLIGEDAKPYAQAFNKESTLFYTDTASFLDKTNVGTFQNSTVLVKGSRSFELEQVTQKFEKQAHQSVLEVDLSLMEKNLNFYRKKIGDDVRLCAMVKAFSYGAGGHEIAEMLEKNNVDYLAVAYADEGIALREKNISLPIIVMNPEDPQPAKLAEFNLEPAIYSFESLSAYDGFSNGLKVHLKLDTGMHRLGFLENEIDELKEELKSFPFDVVSVFTHLAASDDSNYDTFTKNQLDKFDRMAGILDLEDVFYHALNTSGISRFPKHHMGMVRLGIGLYGVSPIKEEQAFLEPAIRLKSTISQIKEIAEGDSVGYSRSFKASGHTKIGIVPLGYADGIHRSFGNGNGSVIVCGQQTETLGNICMDMCMINLNGIDAKIGDEVEFFGPSKSILKTASEMNTIPYELLANVSQRVKRIFYFD
ncbi:MAG: bifunctional UDP-N-acetylmuramoyl-tripeptide:D-alanyl-D-alanine ligase/alanine racemase [Bacteroidota bacterium]